MKKLSKPGVIGSLLITVAWSVSAQRPTKPRQLERQKLPQIDIRQSYERAQLDGAKVTIYQVTSEGKMVTVSPGQVFKKDDQIKARIETNFDANVYVVNLTPGGKHWLLFPKEKYRVNKIRAGQSANVPFVGNFLFDEEPGLELILVVMSRGPVPFLEAALDRAPPNTRDLLLDDKTVRMLERLNGTKRRPNIGGIATQAKSQKSGALKTRMLTLVRRNEASILVVSDVQRGSTRLQSGEVSIFEIRLNHQ